MTDFLKKNKRDNKFEGDREERKETLAKRQATPERREVYAKKNN